MAYWFICLDLRIWNYQLLEEDLLQELLLSKHKESEALTQERCYKKIPQKLFSQADSDRLLIDVWLFF